MNRGEVRWITGDDAAKGRPGVVLTRQAVVGQLRSVLVAPVTTRVRNLPSEVALGPEQGLPKPCVANLDNLALVDAELLGAVICELDAPTMAAICTALPSPSGANADAEVRLLARVVAMHVSVQLPLADVKNMLSEVVDHVEREHDRVCDHQEAGPVPAGELHAGDGERSV